MARRAVIEPFIDDYQRAFDSTWSDDTPVDRVRFVVLDSETTGLNPVTDRLITIGAVAVQNGDIVLEDSFEALLRIERNTAAAAVHGITRDETRRGLDEPDALRRFLQYLRDGVVVGHHIGHDMSTLNAAYQRHFGFDLMNRSLDTMDLTLHLERSGAFTDPERIREFTLDSLCARFGVVPHDRHTAGGDAFLTAQVFLRLLHLAARYGRAHLGALGETFIEVEE